MAERNRKGLDVAGDYMAFAPKRAIREYGLDADLIQVSGGWLRMPLWADLVRIGQIHIFLHGAHTDEADIELQEWSGGEFRSTSSMGREAILLLVRFATKAQQNLLRELADDRHEDPVLRVLAAMFTTLSHSPHHLALRQVRNNAELAVSALLRTRHDVPWSQGGDMIYAVRTTLERAVDRSRERKQQQWQRFVLLREVCRTQCRVIPRLRPERHQEIVRAGHFLGVAGSINW